MWRCQSLASARIGWNGWRGCFRLRWRAEPGSSHWTRQGGWVDLSTDSGLQAEASARAFAATAIRHRWPVWHAALRALGTMMRAVPRTYRFPVAVFLAQLLLPVVRKTSMFRERRKSVVETPLEIVLYSILRALEQAGTEFDPGMQVRGFELIEASMKSGKGVLLISARTMLGHAFLRYLADHGYSAWLVAPHPYPLFGRRTTVRTISPSLKYFLEVREHLKKREIVMATPDRGRARRARTLSIKTSEGTLHFAPPLIEVALNAKADVIFVRTCLKDGVIDVELSASSSSDEPEANAIALRYASLVRHHVGERESFDPGRNSTLSG
jgi:hypothetical protein